MARQVYAHYMVGLTSEQQLSQWQKDVSDAQAASIDGFALNIGPSDSWTTTQLDLAYQAAEAAGFDLFLSFDMASDWDVSSVVSLVNSYKGRTAQVLVDGKPMVSTFEGPGWADNWASVRDQTGGVFLMPCWTSLGPSGVSAKLGDIDGVFSWNAWPAAGQSNTTTDYDVQYKNVIGDKPYMMGVSPYFYVNLASYSKNWYSSSESLWFDRWQQVLDVSPDYIEIITWNDFSESSYIADVVDSQLVSGVEAYVNGFDHSAYRRLLPYFIKAYKMGSKNVELPGDETAIAWYRTTSATLGVDGGTVWGQDGTQSASLGVRDVVSVITVTVDSKDFHLAIGDTNKTYTADGANRVNYFEIPFDGALGNVALTMNGQTVTGAAITDTLPLTGYVNFNAVSIGL